MGQWICCGAGPCFTLFGDEGICEEAGAVTFGEGTSCAGVDCDAFLAEEVSCCIDVNQIQKCHAFSHDECREAGGTAEFPAGCGATISCGGLAEGACCVVSELGAECVSETRAECEEDGGVFHQGIPCDQILCVPDLLESGCRGPRQDEADYTGYDEGDKVHSLDLCEPVVMAAVRHRSEGGADLDPAVQPGYVTPVTANEVRNKKLSVAVDPCRRAEGVWAKGEDGYLHLFLCSQPESGASSARFNEGFMFKQKGVDREGRLRPGYVGGVVGVEPPRWAEIVYRDNPILCGGIPR